MRWPAWGYEPFHPDWDDSAGWPMRVEDCPHCGGDGGWEVPYAVDHRDGGVISYQQQCEACGGTGDIVVEDEPVTLEDLAEEDALEEVATCGRAS